MPTLHITAQPNTEDLQPKSLDDLWQKNFYPRLQDPQMKLCFTSHIIFDCSFLFHNLLWFFTKQRSNAHRNSHVAHMGQESADQAVMFAADVLLERALQPVLNVAHQLDSAGVPAYS